MTSLFDPAKVQRKFNKVAILFSGGPAPAANAVISTAAASFLRHGTQVVGIRRGYSKLQDFDQDHPLVVDYDYFSLNYTTLKRTRNTGGILIGTSRANPGKSVSEPAHLNDPVRTKKLRAVYDGLRSIGVEALISIGGDDTLKTANKFQLFQEYLPKDLPRIPIVHLPKTIDNDYFGIDFTFGYFTAVDVMANEIRNLLADAEANAGYFIVEAMGRSAGWLAYGAAIAGEASLVLSVEDISPDDRTIEKTVVDESGTYMGYSEIKQPGEQIVDHEIMNRDQFIARIVTAMRTREKNGRQFGVIVIAEGLAELLPAEDLVGIQRDDHGHIKVSDVNLYRKVAKWVGTEFKKQTGIEKKMTPLQLGYETRCARPLAFDVILGSQLGVGAFRALAEQGLTGVMVSVEKQMELKYVPFADLVNPQTLVTQVRHIIPNSDFHLLARFLEHYPQTK
ncbi:MAG: 6-phosphofructokinase [Planctomycetales bacterium]|nr:6-phosphofructokinase [Planctomycetales bacterium]